MESKFQTSFIPKKSLDEEGGVKIKTPINILFVSSVIIMLFAVGISSGVFFYQKTIEDHIATKKAEIKDNQKVLDNPAVQDIARIDTKLRIATNLLNSHTAISSLFTILQESTLKNIRFTDFSFSYLSPTKVTISMKGQATSFEVVAKQIEAFATSPSTKTNFSDSIFSDLVLDDKGNVNFSFLTNINPKTVLYKNNFIVSTSTVSTAANTAANTATTTASSTNSKKP